MKCFIALHFYYFFLLFYKYVLLISFFKIHSMSHSFEFVSFFRSQIISPFTIRKISAKSPLTIEASQINCKTDTVKIQLNVSWNGPIVFPVRKMPSKYQRESWSTDDDLKLQRNIWQSVGALIRNMYMYVCMCAV